jgi:hypothetical protein
VDPTDPPTNPVPPIDDGLPSPPNGSDEAVVQPRRGRTLLFVGAGVVVALIAGSLAFVLTRSNDVALALSMSKGNTFQYRETISIDGKLTAAGVTQPLKETVTSDATWRVVAVDAKGIATVEVTASNGEVTLNGQTLPVTRPVTFQVRMSPDGRIVSGGDLAASNAASAGPTIPGGSQFTPVLPDHEVGPGDTWTKSFDSAVPFLDGTLHYSTTNRFLRYETVGGRKAAVLRSTMTVPMSLRLDLRKVFEAAGTSPEEAGLPAGSNPAIRYEGRAVVTGTYWLDPDHGQLIKARISERPDLTLTFEGIPDIPEGTTGSFTGTMNVVLDPR